MRSVTKTLRSKTFFHHYPSLQDSLLSSGICPSKPLHTPHPESLPRLCPPVPTALPSTATAPEAPRSVCLPHWGQRLCLPPPGQASSVLPAPDWESGWLVIGFLSRRVSGSSCGPPRASWAVGGIGALGPRPRWKPSSVPTLPGKVPSQRLPCHPPLGSGGVGRGAYLHPRENPQPPTQRPLPLGPHPLGERGGGKAVGAEVGSQAECGFSSDAPPWQHYSALATEEWSVRVSLEAVFPFLGHLVSPPAP